MWAFFNNPGNWLSTGVIYFALDLYLHYENYDLKKCPILRQHYFNWKETIWSIDFELQLQAFQYACFQTDGIFGLLESKVFVFFYT